MNIDNDRLAFCDTETLGLDPLIHPVWELAVITGGEEHHWFVRVDDVDREFADPVALDLNGFTERYDHEVALPDYTLASTLAGLLAGKVIVGANPHFDLSRLAAWFHRTGRDVPWHYRPCCIESVLYGVNLGYLLAESNGSSVDVPWRALDLYERVTGLTQPDEDRHTALGDARFVRSLWEWAHR